MEINIKYTDEDVVSHGVKCAVFGDSGTGKTRLLPTAPDPIIISTEHGLLSVRDSHVPYIEVNNISDVESAYEYFAESDEAKQYQTIGFDGLSEISELLLMDLKPGYKDKRQAYGEMAEKVGTMIRAFRNIKGYNVVFTAKMQKKEDEDLGITYFQPMLPGKVLPQGLPYLVDELFCTKVFEQGSYGEEDYKREIRLQTFVTDKVTCKDRSGALDEFEVMDLSVIFDKIKGVSKNDT